MALSLGLGNQLYTQTQLGHNPRRLSLTTLSIKGVMETHKNDSGVNGVHECCGQLYSHNMVNSFKYSQVPL